jgi:hypothetical protein
VPGGWFFSEAAGPGETGFAVIDDASAKMWTEFNRLGGVNAVGYPVSNRFLWSGFLCQAMQRVVFQWRPDIGQVYFANVFDLMSEAGKDDWLLSTRQTPKPFAFNEAGKTWDQIVSLRLAALNANPAIKAAYNSVVGDPVTMNGLPTSHVSDMGDNYTIRAQRVVIQQWKVAKPWAAANQVTFGLGGSIAKEAGLLPLGSGPGPVPTTAPPPTPDGCASGPVIESFTASPTSIAPSGSSTLSWGNVTNATHISISQGIGEVTAPNSVVVSPDLTTNYVLTAIGCGGKVMKQATVTVSAGIAPVPTATPLPETGDMSMTDINLNASNHVTFTFNRTGFGSSPAVNVKYQVWRYKTVAPTGWGVVKEGTVAATPGGNSVVTGYIFASQNNYSNNVQVNLDPEHELSDTDVGNNVLSGPCNATTHSCP